jgi:hypothetical protein
MTRQKCLFCTILAAQGGIKCMSLFLDNRRLPYLEDLSCVQALLICTIDRCCHYLYEHQEWFTPVLSQMLLTKTMSTWQSYVQARFPGTLTYEGTINDSTRFQDFTDWVCSTEGSDTTVRALQIFCWDMDFALRWCIAFAFAFAFFLWS